MSKKHFSTLLLVTIVVTVLVFLIPVKTAKDSAFQKYPLLPGLAALVNDMEYLKLTGAGGETIATLHRRGGEWLVAESSDYQADWTVLHRLLSDLVKAEVIEEKTSNPELYPRLGVEDVSGMDAGGILIEFAEETGQPPLIVGNKAQGREGSYVRLVDSVQSALIDRTLNVPAAMSQWLELEIIDVPADELVEFSIGHPDGEQILLKKASADEADFQLQNIPASREVKSSWAVNSIAAGMASLKLDAVAPQNDLDWTAAVETRLLTATGLRVSAQLVSVGDEHWIKLNATAHQPAASGEPVEAGTEPEGFAELSKRVSRINERVAGWAYKIPQYKHETLTKRMDDVLQSLEASEETSDS